jgi:serine protease Do
MKSIFLFSCTFALAALGSTHLLAQNAKDKKQIQEEKIIVEGKDGQGNMTIEIKDGEVFIDGKKVEGNASSKDGKTNIIQKKIIINGKDVTDDPEYQDFSFPFQGMDMQASGRPMLGVNTKPSAKNDGAEIESVVPGSPAEKFGLKAGDVITKVGTENIYTPKDLVDAIAKHKSGEKVDITFERGSDFLTKNVELSERKNAMTFRGMMPLEDDEFFKGFGRMFQPFNGNDFNSMRPAASSSPKIGISVEDRADGEGVLVNEVSEESAAKKAGIQKGDVLVQFGSSMIENVDQLMEAIAEHQGKADLDVKVKRNGTEKKLKLNMPKNLKKRDL